MKRELKEEPKKMVSKATKLGAKENPMKRELKEKKQHSRHRGFAAWCKGKSHETGIESHTRQHIPLYRLDGCKGKSHETGIESGLFMLL